MRIHKGLARAALTAGVVAGVLMPGGGTAVAAPSTDVGTTALCTYTVYYDGLAVRENPSPNSVVRKFKAYGSKVSGPCMDYWHSDSEDLYEAVYCSCATDGIGWMRKLYLG